MGYFISSSVILSHGQILSRKSFFAFPFNSLTADEQDILLSYHYPENVRELESLLNRVFLFWQSSAFKSSRLEILKAEIEKEKDRWKRDKHLETSDSNNDGYLVLFNLMTQEGRSFWEVVHKSYIKHEISKEDLKKIIRLGLEKSGWSLKTLLPLFNIREEEYKKFLNFLQAQGIKLRNFRNNNEYL